MPQEVMVYPSVVGILLFAFIIASLTFAMLWRKNKTVEAMLVLNAFL